MNRLMFLSVVLLIVVVGVSRASTICDACHCLEVDDIIVVKCKGIADKIPTVDYEFIVWPTTNLSIKAFFNNMKLKVLPKLAGSTNVVEMNFDDNEIRNTETNPFLLFPNLETISLKNNMISELSKDFLKDAKQLRKLAMNNNSFSNINPEVFAHVNQLHEVDFSLNSFTKISAELIEALGEVEIINFQNNKIFTVDNAIEKGKTYKWKELFLANNQFTVITAGMLEKFSALESIDLSSNKLTNIDETAFHSLTKLRLLDLSNNFLKKVSIKLPDSLELLVMANNAISVWPLANTPQSLTELELQDNMIEDIFPQDQEVNNLKIMNLSSNHIEVLPNTMFAKLEILDLSRNYLTAVPQNMNMRTPFLKDLILDGNRIEVIEFVDKITLASLSLSYMPDLQQIDAKSFSNLEGIKVRTDGSGTCFDLTISHNPKLHTINENAFDGNDICRLDLSFNQLTSIPQNLTDWKMIDDGIDLQGNPFSCSCDAQWMLDLILNQLYQNEKHQYLLADLKCHSPEAFKDNRFIKYLNHKNSFCNPITPMNIEQKEIQTSSFGGNIQTNGVEPRIKLELSQGPGFIIVIAMCIIILGCMIAIGIHWTREQNRRLARRNRMYEYE